MDYKSIIKSQELRLKILGLTEFIPDKFMIKLQYKIATGRKLNLKNPKRFTEKLQWYKLKYRDPLMTQCADKYGVRTYVKGKGYEDILVPLYGVYDKADDINFELLPNKFVLKTTNSSHTNILCEDKNKLDIEESVKQLNNWMNKKTIKAGREWAYYDIEPKIICEKYLDKDQNGDLIDYKFMCFNGKVEYVHVLAERFFEDGLKEAIYDLNFNKIIYTSATTPKLNKNIPKPKNFGKMVRIAEDLSKEFPHVRVDLYNIDGTIVFGELTFYHSSGYEKFNPDKYDFILGEKFNLEFK